MTGTTWPGVVPQVTSGLSSAASIVTSGRTAPSLRSAACATRPPRRRGPLAPPAGRIHSNVVSSGATMPARPPPSIVMLQIVIRPSMDQRLDRRAGVLDGVAGHAAGAEAADAPRMRSLAVTPGPSSPT